jgi:cytosine/adenosine deaminase-related metal-dependent hydrolase
MILNNVKIFDRDEPVSLSIHGSSISQIVRVNPDISNNNKTILHFDGGIVFPGFINSHDHLEFNLYPNFGDKSYSNYCEWGKYVWNEYKADIDRVTKIPLKLRVAWGLYKNLLCGVTTVVHHGDKIEVDDSLINVFQDYDFLHSVGFEKNWRLKLNKFSRKRLVVIHAGEGRDEYAKKEIDKLIRWNLFGRKIVAIHGVAMTAQQAQAFEALIWCPVSNLFMFNETAKIGVLKECTPIIFGTDSTLTAGWNLWEHLRVAKENSLVTDIELMEMLTITPAQIWNLNKKGIVKEGYIADLVIAKFGNNKYGFFDLDPENILLVLLGGEIKLYDESLADQIQKQGIVGNLFSKVKLKNTFKYVYGDLSGILRQIILHYPEADLPVTACDK